MKNTQHHVNEGYFEKELRKEGMYVSEEPINDPVQQKSLNDMTVSSCCHDVVLELCVI